MTIVKHYGAEKWCSPCRALRPIIDEIIRENPSVRYQYIDIDNNPMEAKNMGVQSIPTVIIVKNGIETHRIIGIQSKSVYETAIL